jgi:multidrug resistance efflux pump
LELKKALEGPRPEEIEASRGAYEAAKARLKRVETGWREEEKRQAVADWEGAEADLKLAYRELQRTREADIAASRSDYDTKNTLYQSAKARAASAKARLDMLNKGSRDEDIAEARQEMKRLEANLKLLEIGTREEDKDLARSRVLETQAKLDEIDANLREAEIRAPGPAIVDVLAVRKGDLVAPNQPVIRILRAEDMWVKVYVPEPDLGKVRLNQAAEITIDSYPGRVFHGNVLYVSSESEFTPRNVQSADERKHQVFAIKIRVTDPQGIFKSGMAADVTLHLK